MSKKIAIPLCTMLLAVAPLCAQTNTFPSTGKAGIGTTSPSNALDIYQRANTTSPSSGSSLSLGDGTGFGSGNDTAVNGQIMFRGDGWGHAYMTFFPHKTDGGRYVRLTGQSSSYGDVPVGFLVDGKVGIGTITPASPLVINGAPGQSGSTGFPIIDVTEAATTCSGCTGPGLIGERIVLNQTPGAGSTNVGLWVSATNGTSGNIAAIFQNGDVGIGTTTPGSKLEVNGNIKLTSGSGASITYPDSTVQSTAWTGTLTGGDYAESMDVSGDRDEYEPGDVLVLDPKHPGQVFKSSVPYSSLAAGVYATKPGVVGRRQKAPKELSTTEVPMAMVGVVPTKVTAENGPIEVGDLLVVSAKQGYAMKGTDRARMIGAVIGKAMQGLDTGTGVIEVLITLQ